MQIFEQTMKELNGLVDSMIEDNRALRAEVERLIAQRDAWKAAAEAWESYAVVEHPVMSGLMNRQRKDANSLIAAARALEGP